MKKLIKLLAMLAIIASTIPLKGEERIAVTYDNPYTENFDGYSNNTLPTGWVNTTVNGTVGWSVFTGLSSLRLNTTTNPSSRVSARVTTPAFDLSAVSGGRAFIKFNHMEAVRSSTLVDILRIYYRIGEEGDLVKLDSFQNGASTNEEAVIELPSGAKVSNLYIVFEEYSNSGGAIYVDDLVIYARPDYTVNAVATAITSSSSILTSPEEISVTASVSNYGRQNITEISLTLEVEGIILATENQRLELEYLRNHRLYL